MRDYILAEAPLARNGRWFREIIQWAPGSEQVILVVREKDAVSIATALRNAYLNGRKDQADTVRQVHRPAGPDQWNPEYCMADSGLWPCKTISVLDEPDWHCPECGYDRAMLVSATGPGAPKSSMRCHRCGTDS